MGELAKQVDAHVGKRIRKRRTSMGLTQENLAHALQLSYQQLQKYETGANRISVGRLYEVANCLDTDVSFFFEDLELTFPDEPLEHGGKTRSTINLVRDFSDIDNPFVRSAVSGLVKAISGMTGGRKKSD